MTIGAKGMLGNLTDVNQLENEKLIGELLGTLIDVQKSVTPVYDFLLLIQGGNVDLIQGGDLQTINIA